MSKTYKCTNYGICTEAEKETVFQETDLEEVDGKFVCPKCGQELEEIEKKPGVNWKLIAIIAAAVIVLGGGTAALLLGGKGDGAKSEAVEQPPVIDPPVAEPDTTSPDEVIKPEGEKSDLDDETGDENPQPTPTPTPDPPSEPTTYDLGWGTYKGEMQGGKPHGTGTVVVTKAHSIDLKNGTSRQVNKGDKLKSAIFKNGKLTQCYIHYANGEVETITIGY